MTSLTTYQPQWIREDFIDFVAEKFHPTWALKKVKAEVIKIQSLSQDFFKIQLRPNQNFKADAFEAGQSIAVTLVLNGVRQQRQYSVVNLSKKGEITIAVKQQGNFSKAMTSLSIGSIVEISQPQGEFVLNQAERPILFLASGSGITAIYSLIQKAVVKSHQEIDLIYFTRDDAFHAELKALALATPHFRYHHFNTIEQKQHLTLALLNKLIQNLENHEIYACGSSAMMKSVEKVVKKLNLEEQYHSEFFQIVVDESLEAQPVKFLRSQQDFEAKTNLLESAEQAGLKPAHGCRMGICNTCSCTKVSGSVRNVLTGEVDHEANTPIKLCISQAISPVVINL
ncbi:oxidoreductase [Acinetobacter sp. NCu2D-2]|uniref:flavin reductase family protein n=1 Tax=Acinetobacter sp. NCu2D-2 TaxID=1608473 RepID=UPI0007CDFE87|nr:iron-sulfur cluster-binding domain-containing protein [Acinetobacter sp. NCu2D-2]ANF81778.1 oxidoreductase [Acinetobacter sp. NCu2D-2]